MADNYHVLDPDLYETADERRKRHKRSRRGRGGGTGVTSADMGARQYKGTGKTSADMGDREKKGTGLRSSDMKKSGGGGFANWNDQQWGRLVEALERISSSGQKFDADGLRTQFARGMRLRDQSPKNSRLERFRVRQAKNDANRERAVAQMRHNKGKASQADLDLLGISDEKADAHRATLQLDRDQAIQQRRDRTADARLRRNRAQAPAATAPGLRRASGSSELLDRMREMTRVPPAGPEPVPAGPQPVASFPPGPSRPWEPEPLTQHFDDPFGGAAR